MKKITTAILTLVLMLSMTLPACAWNGLSNADLGMTTEQAESINKLDIYINGQPFNYDKATYGIAYIDRDRTFIPMRVIAEHFGLTVTWEQETATAKCEGPNGLIEMKNGDHFITIAGEKKESDVEVVQIKNGRTYVGLRIFLNAIGITDENITWRPGVINIITSGNTTATEGTSLKGTSDFKSLPKLMNALNAFNATDANWNNDITGQLYIGYYDEYVGIGVSTKIYGSASRFSIDGMWFGKGAEELYHIIWALLDDALTAEDAKTVKAFLTEYNANMASGYDPSNGISATAISYLNTVNNKVFATESGLKYGFTDNGHTFNIDFPA